VAKNMNVAMKVAAQTNTGARLRAAVSLSRDLERLLGKENGNRRRSLFVDDWIKL
jgi:hypothetical protein